MKDPDFHMESIKTQNIGLGILFFKETYFSIFKILRFMTSTSLLLALNAVMVVVFGSLLYSIKILPLTVLAAFLVTFAVYGLNKVTDKAEDSINRPEASPRASGYYLFFSIASMLTGFLIGISVGPMTFFVLFAPVIIGVIYSVKISKSTPRLKEIVGVKSLAVAGSWALTGCLLPDSLFTMKIQAAVIVFMYIFIRVFVGTILCDVLDKKGDLASGLQTIPTRLGRNKTKNLLIFLNSLGIVLCAYCFLTGLFVRFVPVLIFGVLFGYLCIWFLFKDNCKNGIARLMLDGEWLPIVIMLFLLAR